MLKIVSALVGGITLGIVGALVFFPSSENIRDKFQNIQSSFVGDVISHDSTNRVIIVRGLSSKLEEDITVQMKYDKRTVWAVENILTKEGYLIGIRHEPGYPNALEVGDTIFIGYQNSLREPVDIIVNRETQTL